MKIGASGVEPSGLGNTESEVMDVSGVRMGEIRVLFALCLRAGVANLSPRVEERETRQVMGKIRIVWLIDGGRVK
jgi:hypothetical protein